MDATDTSRKARAALLRYVDETYGPGEYRYHLERLADPDDLPTIEEMSADETALQPDLGAPVATPLPSPRSYKTSICFRRERGGAGRGLAAWSGPLAADAAPVDAPGVYRFRADDGAEIQFQVAPTYADLTLRSADPIAATALIVTAGSCRVVLRRQSDSDDFGAAVDEGLGSDFEAALEDGEVWIAATTEA